MTGFLGWMLLVIKVMQQPHNPPRLLVLAEPPGVGAHHRLHRQHVLEQVRVAGVFGKHCPRFVPGHASGSTSTTQPQARRPWSKETHLVNCPYPNQYTLLTNP